jgi:hypothetical protein
MLLINKHFKDINMNQFSFVIFGLIKSSFEMELLNLPSYEHKLKKINDKLCIWDIIRKKYIVLTPEEWVRQHFVHHLINDHNYPKNLIKLESSLNYNQLIKRTDIRVFDREGNLFMNVRLRLSNFRKQFFFRWLNTTRY